MNLRKRILATILVLVMVVGLIPMSVFAAVPAEDQFNQSHFDTLTTDQKYTYLTNLMTQLKDLANSVAEIQGEVTIYDDYKVQLGDGLKNLAQDIEFDLAVAAAIYNGDWDNAILRASMAGQSNRNYSQPNFNQTNGGMGNNADSWKTAAVNYLMQGGVGSTRTTVNWAYGFGSKLNPAYVHSHAYVITILSVTQNGRLNNTDYPGGLASLAYAKFVEEWDKMSTIPNTLINYIAELNQYIEVSDPDVLQANLLEQDCNREDCENGEDCPDWTHRLINVTEDEYIRSVVDFRDNISRDLKIIKQLLSGDITELWNANPNNNGRNYYNNTVAISTIDKLTVAIDFIENGGYMCGIPGGGLFANTNTWLYYKSNFTTYEAKHTTGTLNGEFSVTGETAILPIVDMNLTVLRLGTTANNLGIIYDMMTDKVKDYIKKVEELPDALPTGGNLTQEQYEAGKATYIANAERDLKIAEMLVTGDFPADVASYASKWAGLGTLATPDDFYKNGFNYWLDRTEGPGSTYDKRVVNAISFFNNGGYGNGFSLLGFGLEIEFISNFYPEYSSGLFGSVLVNKGSIFPLMENTYTDLSMGRRTLSELERAKEKYETMLAEIEAAIADPTVLVAALLKDSGDAQLFADLNILLSSIDDIMNILDKMGEAGIGDDVVDTILGATGIGITMAELRSLINTFNSLNINIDSSTSIEDQIVELVGSSDGMNQVIGGILEFSIIPAKAAALLNTVSGYNTAIGLLEGLHGGLVTGAGSLLKPILDSISTTIEPIRPYLGMLSSGVSLVDNGLELFAQISSMISEFNIATLAGDSGTMAITFAAILRDMATLLEKLNETDITGLLGGMLDSIDLSGLGETVTGGLADFINSAVNTSLAAIGSSLEGIFGSDSGLLQDLGLTIISGEQLSVLGDLANSLASGLLNNPAAIAPLLRASADIVERIGNVAVDIQKVIDGDWNALVELLVREGTDLINLTTINEFGAVFTALSDLISGAGAAEAVEPEASAEIFSMISLSSMMVEGEEPVEEAEEFFTTALLTTGFDPEPVQQTMQAFGFNKGDKIDAVSKSFIMGFMTMAKECIDELKAIKDVKFDALAAKIAVMNKLKVNIAKHIMDMKKFAACVTDMISEAKSVIESAKAKLDHELINGFICEIMNDMTECFNKIKECKIDIAIDKLHCICAIIERIKECLEKKCSTEYNVYYDKNADGATGDLRDENSPYKAGVTVTVLGLGQGTIAREGHVFLCWNTKADGSGIDYNEGDTFKILACDVTLYAQWVEKLPEDIYIEKTIEIQGQYVPDLLVCNIEEHEHDEGCSELILICEDLGHEHNGDCYGDELICGVDDEHEHDEDCYGFVCGKDAHTHDDEVCYLLICINEDLGHEHDGDCYGDELICGVDDEHEHDEDCNGLVCGKDAHTHDEKACYLICKEEESEEHDHGDECYGPACTNKEHKHDKDCYVSLGDDITEVTFMFELFIDEACEIPYRIPTAEITFTAKDIADGNLTKNVKIEIPWDEFYNTSDGLTLYIKEVNIPGDWQLASDSPLRIIRIGKYGNLVDVRLVADFTNSYIYGDFNTIIINKTTINATTFTIENPPAGTVFTFDILDGDAVIQTVTIPASWFHNGRASRIVLLPKDQSLENITVREVLDDSGIWELEGEIEPRELNDNNVVEFVNEFTVEEELYTVTYQPGIQGAFSEQIKPNLALGSATPGFSGTPTGNPGWDFAGWLPLVSPTVEGNAIYIAQWTPSTTNSPPTPTPGPTEATATTEATIMIFAIEVTPTTTEATTEATTTTEAAIEPTTPSVEAPGEDAATTEEETETEPEAPTLPLVIAEITEEPTTEEEESVEEPTLPLVVAEITETPTTEETKENPQTGVGMTAILLMMVMIGAGVVLFRYSRKNSIG